VPRFYTEYELLEAKREATAEAKLAGELAMREAAAEFFIQEQVKWHIASGITPGSGRELGCSCYGTDKEDSHAKGCARRIAKLIRVVPLTPDSAGVLDRIKRAERARAETFRDAVLHERYQLAEAGLDNDQVNAVLGLFDDMFPVEQAAIADGKGDEDGKL
jgi:hypothetical protein